MTAFDELLRRTDPGLVTIELDCGWVKVAGLDPALVVSALRDKLALYDRFEALYVEAADLRDERSVLTERVERSERENGERGHNNNRFR